MRGRAAWTACLIGAVVIGAAGCSSYAPLTSAPVPGADVALLLTDRGRAAIGDRVGPEMDQLRGRVVALTADSVTIAIAETVTLRGVSAKWSDEQFVLHRDNIGSVRTRTFSRARSSILAGTIGAATTVFIVSGGFGLIDRKIETDPSKPPVGPGPDTKVGSLIFPFRSDF